MRKRMRIWTWAVPSVFSLLGILAVGRSLGSFAALAQVHPHWADLCALAVVYPVFAAGRGLRFRQLLHDRQSFGKTVSVGWLYSAACSVLPGGLGEVSLPLIYRGAPGGAAHATAAMAVARVQDLLSWLLVLVLAGFSVSALPSSASVLIALSALCTAVLSLLVFVPPARQAVFTLAALIPWPQLRTFLVQIDERLAGMAYNLPSWLVTFALRILSILSYYFALRAFGAPVSIGEAAIGGALAALLLVLPVQGVAGLGTVEVWWIMILRLFGTPWPVAAVAAIGVHLSMLLLSLAVGGLSFKTAPRLLST